MQPFRLRTTSERDWQRVRDLRLEMLEDSPLAFAQRLADARGLSEDEWRTRGERGEGPTTTVVVAETDEGRWLGTMGGYLPGDGTGPWLVGVYVTPSARGRRWGVAPRLLSFVERWARKHGDALSLEVHEKNLGARRFYERHGFVPDDAAPDRGRVPHPLESGEWELRMMKRLRG